MNHLNNLLIEGILVADPEIIAVAGENKTMMVKFVIASDRIYFDKEKKKQKETLFLPALAWGSLAELCMKHLSKGLSVRVVGRLRQSRWETLSGEKRTSFEAVAQHIEFRRSRNDRTSSEKETVVFEEKEGESDNISESMVIYKI